MLIDADDLGSWMGKTLDPGRASQAIRIAEGELLSATRLTPWPSLPGPVPDDLAAWCLQLSAIAYVDNPKAATERQVGGIISQWAPTDQARWQQILAAAQARYSRTALPRGKFPPAQPWPDQARPWGVGQVYY